LLADERLAAARRYRRLNGRFAVEKFDLHGTLAIITARALPAP
jgi:hypothetical protein